MKNYGSVIYYDTLPVFKYLIMKAGQRPRQHRFFIMRSHDHRDFGWHLS